MPPYINATNITGFSQQPEKVGRASCGLFWRQPWPDSGHLLCCLGPPPGAQACHCGTIPAPWGPPQHLPGYIQIIHSYARPSSWRITESWAYLSLKAQWSALSLKYNVTSEPKLSPDVLSQNYHLLSYTCLEAGHDRITALSSGLLCQASASFHFPSCQVGSGSRRRKNILQHRKNRQCLAELQQSLRHRQGVPLNMLVKISFPPKKILPDFEPSGWS